jgi:hypothetical protein
MTESRTGALTPEWKYADDFRRVYATHSFNMVSDYDTRLTFGLINPILQQEPATMMPKAQGEYKMEVILPFRALKELRDGLDRSVREMEMRFGEIKIPKRPEDIFKQP